MIFKWAMDGNSSAIAIRIMKNGCVGVFVDMNSTLYCAIWDSHEVLATSVINIADSMKTVAGTGCSGPASNMLYELHGIFVDINFSLYVADCGNNRIQRFEWGQLNGSTVAENGAAGTISLSCPTEVVLDGDGYIFIADRSNDRIVGQEPNGFRCIVRCFGNRPASNQLNRPQTIRLDGETDTCKQLRWKNI